MFPLKYLEVETQETLAYREVGSGEVMILLHGNMSSSVHMEPLMEALKDEYHVLAIDLVGFGDSTYNRQLNSLKDFADDIVSFVNLKKIDTFKILGWSTGGGIALEVAAMLKERVTEILLMSSVGPQGYPMVDVDGNRISTRDEIASHPLQVVPVLNAYEKKDGAFVRFVWDNSIFVETKPNKEEYDKYVKATLQQRNLIDVDYALVHFNITDDNNGVCDGSGIYKDISSKIKILHGAKDLVVSIDEAHKMKSVFEDQADLIVFDEAGHSIIMDDFDNLVSVIKEG